MRRAWWHFRLWWRKWGEGVGIVGVLLIYFLPGRWAMIGAFFFAAALWQMIRREEAKH